MMLVMNVTMAMTMVAVVAINAFCSIMLFVFKTTNYANDTHQFLVFEIGSIHVIRS